MKKTELGLAPQGQVVAKNESGPAIDPTDAISQWLTEGVSGMRRQIGKYRSARTAPTWVKLEMLRDPVVSLCLGFTGATLVKAKRIIECRDEQKRRFFEALFRAWEREFVLQANMAVALGSVGLIKRWDFRKPKPQDLEAGPVWSGSATPYIIKGFDQLHPSYSMPKFKDDGRTFDGIEVVGEEDNIDVFNSLWLTLRQEIVFGAYRGAGRLEQAYSDWWTKHFSRYLYLVAMQKRLNRAVQVDYPEGSTGGEANREIALKIGNALRGGSTVAIPSTVYESVNTIDGETQPTGVRKWALNFLEGSADMGNFHSIEDQRDQKIALGLFVPPQTFLNVKQSALGGPTTADVLSDLAQQLMMMDAADIDRHINDYVFPPISRMNFPKDSPEVRVHTKGLETASEDQLFDMVSALLGKDPDTAFFDMRSAMERLKFPLRSEEKVKEMAESAQGGSEAPGAPKDGGDRQTDRQDGEKPTAAALAATEKELGEEQERKVETQLSEPLPSLDEDPVDAKTMKRGLPGAVEKLLDAVPELRKDLGGSLDLGGPGSGHWGHRGRPGKVGGSLPRDAGMSVKSGKDWLERYKAKTGKEHPSTRKKSSKGGKKKIAAATIAPEKSNTIEEAEKDGGPDRSKWSDATKFIAGDTDGAVVDGPFPLYEGADEEGVKRDVVSELVERTGEPFEDVNAVIARWSQSSNDHDYRSLSIQEAAADEFGVELSDYQKQQIRDNAPSQKQRKELIATEERLRQEYEQARKEWQEDKGSMRARASYTRMIKAKDALRELEGAACPDMQKHILGAPTERNHSRTRKILRAMYEYTQERFAEAGISHVRLYRGVFDKSQTTEAGEVAELSTNTLTSWSTSMQISAMFGSYKVAIDVPVERVLGTAQTGFGALEELEMVVIGASEGVTDHARVMGDIYHEFHTSKDLGGPGSGNWGHRGRPGKVGGSLPRDAGMSVKSGQDWLERYKKKTGKEHPEAKKIKKTKKKEVDPQELVSTYLQYQTDLAKAYKKRKEAEERGVTTAKDHEAYESHLRLEHEYLKFVRKDGDALIEAYRDKARRIRESVIGEGAEVELSEKDKEEIERLRSDLRYYEEMGHDSLTIQSKREKIEALEGGAAARERLLREAITIPEERRGDFEAVTVKSDGVKAGIYNRWREAVHEDFAVIVMPSYQNQNTEITIGKMTEMAHGEQSDSGRAFARGSNVYLSGYSKKRVVMHELGHVLEHSDRFVRTAAIRFYDRRTKGEIAKPLGAGFADNEFTKRDDFIDPYIGKDYNGFATEVVSMGLEYMYENPIKLAREDPDMFDFIYAVTHVGEEL